MKFTPDLTETNLQLVPGIHRGRLIQAESHVSKRGNQCVRTRYELCDGPLAKSQVSVVTPVGGKGAQLFVSLARAFVPSYLAGEFDFQSHIGKIVDLVVSEATDVRGEPSFMQISPRAAGEGMGSPEKYIIEPAMQC